MNSENIKQLIELFGTLGASGKEAFLWFLALDFAKFISGILIALLVVVLIYRLICKAIRSDPQYKALKKLADAANIRLYFGEVDGDAITKILKHYMPRE